MDEAKSYKRPARFAPHSRTDCRRARGTKEPIFSACADKWRSTVSWHECFQRGRRPLIRDFCQDPPSAWAITAKNDEPSACSGRITDKLEGTELLLADNPRSDLIRHCECYRDLSSVSTASGKATRNFGDHELTIGLDVGDHGSGSPTPGAKGSSTVCALLLGTEPAG
jgi:hypothetical protein